MLRTVLRKYWKQHPSKITVVQPFISYLANYPSKMNKTCWAQLEKKGQTHKSCSIMESCTWVCQCWLTNKESYQFCADTGCSLEDLPGAMDYMDR